MKPQVYHVDAFTSQPFRGNSAGVVFPADNLADNLSEAQMQLIARELGHSETAFLLHSDDSDVRIRYFTPTVEVPICGHATVAAHYVRAKVLGLGNCTVWQTSLAGKHRVLFCCTATTAMCASATLRQRLKFRFVVTRQ